VTSSQFSKPTREVSELKSITFLNGEDQNPMPTNNSTTSKFNPKSQLTNMHQNQMKGLKIKEKVKESGDKVSKKYVQGFSPKRPIKHRPKLLNANG
jgi:hypothetical protein